MPTNGTEIYINITKQQYALSFEDMKCSFSAMSIQGRQPSCWECGGMGSRKGGLVRRSRLKFGIIELGSRLGIPEETGNPCPREQYGV